ncbi:hypothetical protein WMY93_028207 [Mugilogobius chulae]|uniref:Uncharacterized protein n=1 Tax=Mugilogobius chulae TaxID=88201 RepID=A0AAW0MZT3_9GOBI
MSSRPRPGRGRVSWLRQLRGANQIEFLIANARQLKRTHGMQDGNVRSPGPSPNKHSTSSREAPVDASRTHSDRFERAGRGESAGSAARVPPTGSTERDTRRN